MGRKPSPRMVALGDQVIAYLREQGRPCSTMEVADAVAGGWRGHQDAYRILCRLERTGAAVATSYPEMRSVFWRLVEADEALVRQAERIDAAPEE